MLNLKTIQEKFDWLGHILEMLAMAGIIGLVLWYFIGLQMALIIGFSFGIGHFHGREKRDYEVTNHVDPPHFKGYNIFKWSADNITDFVPTLFAGAVLIAYLINPNLYYSAQVLLTGLYEGALQLYQNTVY